MYRIPATPQSVWTQSTLFTKIGSRRYSRLEMNGKWTLPLIGAMALGAAILADSQAQELPSGVSKYLSKQSIVRASVRLGSNSPERWFVAYDQHEQGRVALIERDTLTDDKAFETKRMFGHSLLLQGVKSITVPNAETSFLLSFEQEGEQDTNYFSVVTFSPGALDIKLFVSAINGKAEVLNNPFRVRIWNKVSESSRQYQMAEYRLLNLNGTKLAKVREEVKASE